MWHKNRSTRFRATIMMTTLYLFNDFKKLLRISLNHFNCVGKVDLSNWLRNAVTSLTNLYRPWSKVYRRKQGTLYYSVTSLWTLKSVCWSVGLSVKKDGKLHLHCSYLLLFTSIIRFISISLTILFQHLIDCDLNIEGYTSPLDEIFIAIFIHHHYSIYTISCYPLLKALTASET